MNTAGHLWCTCVPARARPMCQSLEGCEAVALVDFITHNQIVDDWAHSESLQNDEDVKILKSMSVVDSRIDCVLC